MINITPYCTKFHKKAYEFLDNKSVKKSLSPGDVTITRGVNGYTAINERLLPDFLTWLSPTTRLMVLDGNQISDIIGFLDGYIKDSIPLESIRRPYRRNTND